MERVEVAIVGGGLSGLRAAHLLSKRGLDVALFEASDRVGGRVRTDHVDGFRIDRGFQLYNPAYPAGRVVFDHDALDLRHFGRGVGIFREGRVEVFADPFAVPSSLRDLAMSGSLTFADRLALSRLAIRSFRHLDMTNDAPVEQSTAEFLVSCGIRTEAIDRVIRPFLQGVFLEFDLSTSARVFSFVLRSFLKGLPAVPAGGMEALPAQLAGRMPAGVIRTGARVTNVVPHRIDIDGGDSIEARAVLVAASPHAASELLDGIGAVEMLGVTTYWHHAPSPPRADRLLVVDSRLGPIANTAVMTNVAPTYGIGTGALVVSSVIGAARTENRDADVRRELATLYGTSTTEWRTVAVSEIDDALPAQRVPKNPRQPVRVNGCYVAGDHRDTSSIQGALVSGRRAAEAILVDFEMQQEDRM